MKNIILALIVLTINANQAHAGTTKSLNEREQSVVAAEFAKLIADLGDGDGANLGGCLLADLSAPERPSKLSVFCDFISSSGLKADVEFDHVALNRQQEVIGVRFLSLVRSK